MKKRFLAAAAALMLAVCMLSGCGDNDNPPVEEITVSAGNSAVFTVSDKALYPIAREEPTADECIEKTVVITFSGATRVGLAIECENVLDGIMYSVNDGAATAFAAGTVFERDVTENETSVDVRIRIWVAGDAPASIAGQTLSFTLTAMAA